MSRLPCSKLDRGNEAVDNKLKAEVEDGNDDEASHDRDLQVDARFQLVDLIVVDAALLSLQ